MKKVYITILSVAFIMLAVAQTAYSQTKLAVNTPVAKVSALSHDAVLYPNPVTDNKFFIKSGEAIVNIDVINVVGQSIKKLENISQTGEDIEVQLGNCEKGMYLVKIRFSDEKSIIKKLLVK